MNVEESQQLSLMSRGRRLLLVVVTVVVSLGLIIAGACMIGRDEPGLTTSGNEWNADAPLLAEGSVELDDFGRLTHEARQFWQNLTLDQVVSHGVPFTRYNRHYTRFFLKEGETAEIVIEANVPLGASLQSSHEGISVALIPGGAPYDGARAHDYVPATETGNGGYFSRINRKGNNWQVNWAMTATESDYYWLILTNVARQDAWCHFTVSVPSD